LSAGAGKTSGSATGLQDQDQDHPGNLYRRTFGDVESLELDGLSVVDHGREVRVCVGRRAGVPVVGHQRRFFLGRQTRTCRTARPGRQRHLQQGKVR